MKLRTKIFLGICIPALMSIIILSSFLIKNSFNTNKQLQINLYIQELNNLKTSIETTKEKNNKYNYETILELIGDYYKEKEKYIILYYKNDIIYSNNEQFNKIDKNMLKTDYENYNLQIKNDNKKYYAHLGLKLDEEYNLIYIRDITDIYIKKDNSVKLCSAIILILLMIVTAIAFLISKTLTKPLSKMKKEMNKLSKGNYDISLKDGNDEIGLLSRDFNIMSKELKKRNLELIDMIESKQQFIDNLSHEMNTPLTSIYGYAKLLENAALNEDQKIKYLQYIQDETNRISEMYKKLLMLSYKENNEIDIKEINLKKLLEEIIKELKPKMEKHKIKLVIENNVENIKADSMLLELAISNLIRNAIENTPENKKITIKTEKTKIIKISVIDEGRGIKKEDIDKIVEPFYRVDKSRSRAHGGAGLGLSIVKRVIELHNGKLNIESEIEKGSTFTIEIPNNLQLWYNYIITI